MRYPTDNNRITSKFGWRQLNGKLDYHSGVDYGCLDNRNPTNDYIKSMADGVVRVSKMNEGGYGNYVVVEHDTYCSLYAHLELRSVKVGDNIKEGHIIGTMGETGAAFGIHLHFDIRYCSYNQFWERWSNREPKHSADPVAFLYKGMNDCTEVYPPEFAELVEENIKLNQILLSINKISEV